MEDGTCPYTLLGVSTQATDKEIKKAKNKMALKFHPDKNPGNEEFFHKIIMAAEMLMDVDARKAYDKVLKAKESARLRDEKLSAERRKDKQDLEKREAAAAESRKREMELRRNLQAQILRVQEETEKMIEAEQQRLRQQMEDEVKKASAPDEYVVTVRWGTQGVAEPNGGYDKDKLRTLFRKYGVAGVVVSKKKEGHALIAFANKTDAERACRFEQGHRKNPFTKLTLRLPEGEDQSMGPSDMNTGGDSFAELEDLERYEAVVLRKMREAQRRKESSTGKIDGDSRKRNHEA